jgi:hypothetical protein
MDPFDQQCSQPYTTLHDEWRATTNDGGSYGDCADGNEAGPTFVGGEQWYRFAGPGGDALPLSTPGSRRCGTDNPGWLSGWAEAGVVGHEVGAPPRRYTGVGRYPATAEGVVQMVVCFDNGNSCNDHVAVGVVRCRGFVLWQLPYAPSGCSSAYCTAPSGLTANSASSGRRLQENDASISF